ncbi:MULTISPECIES: GatB/YqeY domain-containing protein [unclassified Thioalkalivibrio]|uniref:GatB/YqeY domain-containing protein n=1 Tax=unclassified Thioalkalivibrio TaxID=2621013 RepID=UPI0003825E86|nr:MULTISPECIES: GatB/YqeY domain-containing protein [unclassified Thioalkalivibrio]
MSLKARLQDDVKQAMRAREKERLGALRLIQAEVSQFEVDERREADDDAVLAILNRMLKQRRDSIDQYRKGGREDLAEREAAEITVIEAYMPEPLGDAELEQMIGEAIAETGAAGPSDMGKVMGVLKPRVFGRADMGVVSQKVRTALGIS